MRRPNQLIVWHKPKNRTYAFANSLVHGRERALKVGANAIDRDREITEDGHGVVTHEGRAVHEFPGSPNPRRMTLRKVLRLKHRRGFRISTDKAVLRSDLRHGLTTVFESKPNPRAEKPKHWLALARYAKRLGTTLYVMSQPHDGQGIRMLLAAKKAGEMVGADVFVILQTRGVVSVHEWALIDDAKGPAKHMVNRPKEKPGRVVGRVG